jgi:lysophospholipid acyltransferase (LPLAT)-like uncharacterized protein
MTDRTMRLIIRFGGVALRLLASTWRIRLHGAERLPAIRKHQRVILTVWHGELLSLLWVHRGQGVAIMVSEHRDGEIVARVAEQLGYGTVRGSTSKGGTRALLGLVRAIEGGNDGGITPDGPRGPAHVFAPGAAVAAWKSGALLLPIRAVASRAWRLRSWDRFMIPKPFARLDVYYAEPERVTAESPRAAAEQSAHFQRLLENLVPS